MVWEEGATPPTRFLSFFGIAPWFRLPSRCDHPLIEMTSPPGRQRRSDYRGSSGLIVKELAPYSADKCEREAAEAAEKARRDMVSRIRSAKTKALEKARSEERTSLIAYMLNQGRNVEGISLITGYPIDFSDG